nr:MAG TPA: tail assembly chaperone protein [Caudoviricetes sp.]
MANLIDALLAVDDDRLATKPTDTIEIGRLSKMTGTKFVLTIQALSPSRSDEITNTCLELTKGGRFKQMDTTMLHALTILDGVTSFDFNNGALRKKLKAASPKEVIMKLFTAGEVVEIFSAIQKLSGFKDPEEEAEEKAEVKN